jgi:uncharacterized protein
MPYELPLFPLQTVLFPGAPLSLHVFEERYRLMIGRCLDQSAPFGVVLLRSGSETSADDPWARRIRARLGQPPQMPGDEAVPYAVGTLAQIGDSVRLDDGRYYLVAHGVRRFRIQSILQRQPYLTATVENLNDPIDTSASAAADRLRALYERYWQLFAAATGKPVETEELPDNPAELTYALAHRLKVNNARKQRWLEATTLTRAAEMVRVLSAEIALLPTGRPPAATGETWNWN